MSMFPLIQLPRKSEAVASLEEQLVASEVSINSTSEEVRSFLRDLSHYIYKRVSINSTSEEVRSVLSLY